jgi:mRNA interferase MazF
MEKQITEEIKTYTIQEPVIEPVIEEPLEDEYEEKMLTDNVDEFEVPYYKDVKPYSGEVRRGEIYFFDKGPKVGVEQQGGRPGIVVSNNLCNKHSEFVEVVYTTCQPKTELPTHIAINSTPKPCTALCEQVHTLSKKKIRCYYGEITAEEECEINKALKINLALTGSDETEKSNEDYEKMIDNLQGEIDSLLKINKGFENQVSDLKMQLAKRTGINSSSEESIYKSLYNDLLDKVLKLKLQEEK